MGLEEAVPAQRLSSSSTSEGGWRVRGAPRAPTPDSGSGCRKTFWTAGAAAAAGDADDAPRKAARRTRTLFRVFSWAVALLVGFHVLSCGLFFCSRQPDPNATLHAESTFVTSRDRGFLADLLNVDASPEGGVGGGSRAGALPWQRIPRIIHQTYKSREVPPKVQPLVESWSAMNPGWEVRFYDDKDCLELVRKEFPNYLPAYAALPKDVERSDFFRYLVILRFGGVYADIDTESKAPLDSVIQANDSMVAGWEAEVGTKEEAYRRHFVRQRQILQWVFGAEARHPALQEVCARLAGNAFKTFSISSNRATLERTGPGLWTDVVLKHALDPAANIRVLPRIAFGVHPAGDDGLLPTAPGIVVQHHFLGSWKKAGGWGSGASFFSRALHRVKGEKTAEEEQEQGVRDLNTTFFPVSIPWEPPFMMMVHLKAKGKQQASGADVSADLSAWGNWQAGLEPDRSPRVVDIIVKSLGKQTNVVFIDIGAGLGFYTMAAASMGHKVIAFEESQANLNAIQASIKFNNFGDNVDLRSIHLGSLNEPTCGQLDRNGKGVMHGALEGESGSSEASERRTVGEGDCTEEKVAFLNDQLGNSTQVGAIRIGASSRTGWILEGGLNVIRQQMPNVIALEFLPKQMIKHGFEDPLKIIRELYSMGYREIYQAGHICDKRWLQITRAVRLRRVFSGFMKEHLKQPTWCKLMPEKFDLLVKHARDTSPENIVFIHRGNPLAGNQVEEQSVSPDLLKASAM